jgi:ABC-type dipeptide/oligopeptide/nickel transport system ATPase component
VCFSRRDNLNIGLGYLINNISYQYAGRPDLETVAPNDRDAMEVLKFTQSTRSAFESYVHQFATGMNLRAVFALLDVCPAFDV